MKELIYNSLQIREVFHLEFLRWFWKKTPAGSYALKGGVNLRFFFNSSRYSEDMDLDVIDIRVETLKDHVMKILQASSFQDSLKLFGVERVVPPDISKAEEFHDTDEVFIQQVIAFKFQIAVNNRFSERFRIFRR